MARSVDNTYGSGPEPDTSLSDREPDTQFQSQSDDAEDMWEVLEITAERAKQYKVRWAGSDPKTGKPWAQSWVSKRDCTDELVMEWKAKKKQTSKASSARSRGSSATGTTTARGRSGSMATSSTVTNKPTRRPILPGPDHKSISAAPSKAKRKRRSSSPNLFDADEPVRSALPSKKRRTEVELDKKPRKEVELDYQELEESTDFDTTPHPPGPPKAQPKSKPKPNGQLLWADEDPGPSSRRVPFQEALKKKKKKLRPLSSDEEDVFVDESQSVKPTIVPARARKPKAPARNAFSPPRPVPTSEEVAAREKEQEKAKQKKEKTTTKERAKSASSSVGKDDSVTRKRNTASVVITSSPPRRASGTVVADSDVDEPTDREGPHPLAEEEEESTQDLLADAAFPDEMFEFAVELALPPSPEPSPPAPSTDTDDERPPTARGTPLNVRLQRSSGSLKNRMKDRKASLRRKSSFGGDEENGRKKQELRPLPRMSPSKVRRYALQQRERDAEEEEDAPMSSIEAFDSPLKPRSVRQHHPFSQTQTQRDDEVLREKGRRLAEGRAVPLGERERGRRRTLEELGLKGRRESDAVSTNGKGKGREVEVERSTEGESDERVEESNEEDEAEQGTSRRIEDGMVQNEEDDEEEDVQQEDEYIDYDADDLEHRRQGTTEQETDEEEEAYVVLSLDAKHAFDTDDASVEDAANEDSVEVQPGTAPRTLSQSQSQPDSHEEELQRVYEENAELRRENEELRQQNEECTRDMHTLEAQMVGTERAVLGRETDFAEGEAAWDVERAEKDGEIARLQAAQKAWEEEREKTEKEMQEKLAAASEMETELSRLNEHLKSVEKQAEVFREQYAAASGFADEVRRENAELVKRADIAEDRATAGVAMVQGVYEQRVKQMEAEAAKWKLVHERDSRMGDEVRRRASEWEDLKVRLTQTEEMFEQVERENLQMKQLLDQLEAQAANARKEAEERLLEELIAARQRMRAARGDEAEQHAPVVRVTEASQDSEEIVYSHRRSWQEV